MKANDKNKEAIKELLKQGRGRGIKHIINIAYHILENPFVMLDISYNLLANTENTVTDDPLWNELAAYGKFAHGSVDFFNTEQFIDDVANAEVITILKSKELKYDRMTGKIFGKDNIQLGSITIVACYRPFKAEDFENAEIICEYIAAELQESEFFQKIGRIFEENFVSDLIERKVHNKTLINKNVEDIYAHLKSNLYIAVVDIVQYEHTLTHLAYFRDLLESLQPEYKYFIYLNNIVIIINKDNLKLNVKEELNILNEFFKKYKIFAGISEHFQNLFELNKYYRQALTALNYGTDSDTDQNIFLYDDFRLEHFLNSLKDTVNIIDLCDPIVSQMQNHDNEHNTSYLDLMHTHLLAGLDSQMTSERMKLDHDKLCEKLKEIEEIFNIDWHKGNMLLSIFVSIKILRLSSRA